MQNKLSNKKGLATGSKSGQAGLSQSKRQNQEKKLEFEQKLLDVSRTARMVAGGRRFSFRIVVVIGNKMGKVGVGVAKGRDVPIAANKAFMQAQKNLISVSLTENKSIPHLVQAKYSAAQVMLKPAKKGRGVIAGGTVRVVCNLLGVENITAKILGRTNNKLNNAKATIKALAKFC